MFRDYYAILEVDRNCSAEDIRSAYRSLSKKWHPDRNPGKDTSKEMIDINDAYSILKDPASRRLYDVAYDKYVLYLQEQKKRRQVVVYESNIGSDDATKKQNEGTSQKYEEVFDEPFYSGDDDLERKMQASRKNAESLVANFMKNLKKDSKVAAKGAAENCLIYFVMIIIVNVIVAIVVAASK
ncbi:MAG: DnaJ domain-containing protein [Paludibacteraceae bacterium]|nr:DnaJ domain-containing protein [Paludibacteraceae bacterium]